MKIVTIFGTRPEIIRLSRVIPALDRVSEHIIVHTGQNYDPNLYDIFFAELQVRKADRILECRANSLMGQIAGILTGCERILSEEKPDRLLILGDTNSALSAFVAKRMGIPVYHMEAGNRCYDDRVPEEVNRRIIDHSSDILMPYTERSRENLVREGIPGERIYVTGNPIYEVLEHYRQKIEASEALANLGIQSGRYFLATLHRAENVDVPDRLSSFISAFRELHHIYGFPVICSLHPRTRSQLEKQGKDLDGEGIRAIEPLGLFDFVHLEQHAACVLSDSGTVQEECCIFGIPTVTIRDVTERPETIEVGSNILSGAAPDSIVSCVKAVIEAPRNWSAPREYVVDSVSSTVMKIVTGFKWR